MRVVSVVLAAAALFWAVTSPLFRGAGGSLSGAFVLPLSLSAALALFAALGARARRTALAWAGLALVGQAAALQLVRAGPAIGYQHLQPWGALAAPANRTFAVIVLLQAVVVLIAVLRAWPALRSRVASPPAPGRLALVLMAVLLTSATLSRVPLQYAGELVLATLLELLCLLTVGLAVAAVPAEDVSVLAQRLAPAAAATADTDGRFFRTDRFVIVAVLWAVAVTALLSLIVYQRHPHVPDEVSYLLHAKYFARGWLEMPAPPVPEAFELDLMTYEPARWYSPVPPGWPAVLALGARLGAPWLVNPLLSGVCVWLAYILLRDLYGTPRARLGTLLLAVSPWFLFLGMSFMTHQLTLAAGLAGAVAVARWRRGGALIWALPAGIAIGVLGLIRPLEGFIGAMLLGFWALAASGAVARRVLAVAVMAIVSLATAATTLPYNKHFTGKATTFPIMAYTDAHYGPGSNALGFGSNRGLPFGGLDPFPGHGLRDVVLNTNQNLFQVNVELLGWGTGSLLLIALLLFAGRLQRADRWMLLVVLAVVGAHAFYWFSGGPDFGARYWYLILVPALALVVRGLETLGGWFSAQDGARPLLGAWLLAFCTATVFLPWRSADKYFHYRTMRPDMRQLARTHDFGRSLVLVRGRRFPDFMSSAVYNPVDLMANAPIYAWDRSAEVRRRLLDAYRDRTVWIVEGASQTGAGFRVVAGPLPATQLIAESQGVH
jgi:hypothetical protein